MLRPRAAVLATLLVLSIGPTTAAASGPGATCRGDCTCLRADEVHLRRPAEPASERGGQAALAALQEVAGLLLADPSTDWSRVDFDRLRRHLVDLDRVVTRAVVDSRSVDGGLALTADGDAETRRALRRVVAEHARRSEFRGWRLETEHGSGTDAEDAPLRLRLVTDRPDDVPMLRALGFFGYLSVGVHRPHQLLAIARGSDAIPGAVPGPSPP